VTYYINVYLMTCFNRQKYT